MYTLLYLKWITTKDPLSVQFSCSDVFDFLWPHGLQHAKPPCPSPTTRDNSNLCPFTESAMPSNHLILFGPLILLPSIFNLHQGLCKWVSSSLRWPKYWGFSFSISPSNEHSGLISFRIDWFDLLTVQGTLASLLQHHNLKASILLHSAFFYDPTLTSVKCL